MAQPVRPRSETFAEDFSRDRQMKLDNRGAGGDGRVKILKLDRTSGDYRVRRFCYFESEGSARRFRREG